MNPQQRIARPQPVQPPEKKPTVVSKSVGALVLNHRGHTLLVFQAKNKYWEFPKGKMEAGERERDTLRREIFEETGIRNFEIVTGFRRTLTYEFHYKQKNIRRTVIYFLIVTSDHVRISREHQQYAWLPITRARHRLKHHSQQKLLDDVAARLPTLFPSSSQ